MRYSGKSKSSYGANKRHSNSIFTDKNQKRRPINKNSIHDAQVERMIPDNKKLDIKPKTLNTKENSCLKTECETEWKFDLLRKDPTITKKENKKTTPLPKSLIEEKEKSGSLDLSNGIVKLGGSLTTKNRQEMQFPKGTLKRTAEKFPKETRYT